MDKKSNKKKNRSGPGPSKGAQGSESNAKQDVVSNKFLRNGRKREPTRKPNPQHFKGVDELPKPRRSFYSERDRNDVALESRVEVGSARVSHWDSSWTTKKHKYSKYNKEQFLQANCQFLVRAGGNYAVHSVDPDLLVDWDAIELVGLPSREVPFCQICLSQPVAAKITRCGHVYCWSCILCHLDMSDKTCPICFESVHKKDLKSVVPLFPHAYNVGEEITMRLMRREMGSVYAMVKTHWKERELFQLDDAVEDTCFSKLLTASPKQIHELVISKERSALQVALVADMNCPQSCFIEDAIKLLTEREESLWKDQTVVPLFKEVTSLLLATEDKPQPVESGHPVNLPEGKCRIACASAFSDKEASNSLAVHTENTDNGSNIEQVSSVESVAESKDGTYATPRQHYESTSAESIEEEATAADLDIADVSGSITNPTDASKGSYFFYQADDGQHTYLHALNVRMLVKEYGSLELCPDTIQGKIVEKAGLGMTEDIRRRLRFLFHLPLTCDFEVVEMILKPPVISKATKKSFAEEIDKRSRRRKARDVHRRDCRVQEQENQKWG